MSLQTESTLPGGIPVFPFQEVSTGGVGMENAAGAPGGAGVKGPPDFVALRSALEAAVRALRSFHDYVGMLEQQEQARRPGVGAGSPAGAGAVMQPSMVLPALPPREVFPSGPREPGVSARSGLSPAQQAALDTALAQAFAQETAPPRGMAGPGGEVAHFTAGGREGGRLEPLPPPSAMPAPPSLVAAAPPLPTAHSPFAQPAPAPAPAGQPSAVAPVERSGGAFSAGGFPTEAAASPGSSAPLSAFQSPAPLVTSPPPGPAMAAPAPSPAEASWPSSPFFGAAQASTAPFRMVEPPPVIASSAGAPTAVPPPVVAAPAPQAAHAAVPPPSPPVAMHVPAPAPAPAPAPPPAAPPMAPPAAAMPREPIPDQGQVFNFAELLRANGQR